MKLQKGDKAPDFKLKNQDGNDVSLNDYKGKWVVLYFYPKDNTSGCTREAIDFTGHLETFKKLNAEIIGVSPDSVKSHVNFTNKHDLKLTLLSDPEHEALEAYGAWGLKKMYGREYYGVVRSTILVNPDGIVSEAWYKVKVNGHAEAVQCSLQDLSA